MRYHPGHWVLDGAHGHMIRVKTLHKICVKTVGSDTIISKDSEMRRCSEHGLVELVPIYEAQKNSVTQELHVLLYWGCLQCLEKELGMFKEIDMECCYECNEVHNLSDCGVCTVAMCKKHSLSGVCLECVDEGNHGLAH